MSDRPTYETFDPSNNASQLMVMNDYHMRVKHRPGTQVLFFSGAMGSGKSLSMQNILTDIAISENNAILGLSRRTLPDLRDTLFNELVDHIPPHLILGQPKTVSCKLNLINGTKFVSRTFSDNKFKKVRGLAPVAWAIEEATELPTSEAFQEIFKRLGRNKKRFNSMLMLASNPDSPEHWCYKEIIEKAGWVNGVKTRKRKGRNLNIHVYYSVTTDNAANLPDGYIEGILANISDKQAERDIYGQWVNLGGESIYHAYREERNFVDKQYIVDTNYPIHLNFDFNTAEGKPMSACVFQYIKGKFHVFREFIIYKSNTHSMMEAIVQDDKEPGGNGILDYNCQYLIHGDASGDNKQSSALTSDYGIIKDYLNRYTKKRIFSELQVPDKNPGIILRVNLVNGYLHNSLHDVRLFFYPETPVCQAGMKNTQWKKGAHGTEDDSFYAQHVTTALGYGIWHCTREVAVAKRLY